MTNKVTKRISLVDGLKRDEPEPSLEAMRQFVKTGHVAAETEAESTGGTARERRPEAASVAPPERGGRHAAAASPAVKPRPSRVQPVALVPVTIRLRPELAGALKRASLERQLTGEPVFTQQDMVEEALTPWLKKAGYL